MTSMRIVVLGFLSVNCYLLWDPKTKQALIIDPGSSADDIIDAVRTENLLPCGVLLTHAHVDHISAVGAVTSAFQIPVWVNPPERPLYQSPDNALKPWMDAAKDLPTPVDQCPTAGLNFKILQTPGHTVGGVCFYFPDDEFVLTGDTLFKGSYGRTDFPGGDENAIMISIRTRLLTLPPNTIAYPGHGPLTTIAAESSNPLFM